MLTKFLQLVFILAILLSFAITITSYQKSVKSGNNENISRVFRTDEVHNVKHIFPEYDELLNNIPTFVCKQHPVVANQISEMTEKYLSKYVSRGFVEFNVKVSPVLTILLWIVFACLFIDMLIRQLVYIIYGILVGSVISVLGFLLIKQHFIPELDQMDLASLLSYLVPGIVLNAN